MGHSAEELEGVCKSDGTGCPAGMGSGSCSFGNYGSVTTKSTPVPDAETNEFTGQADTDLLIFATFLFNGDTNWVIATFKGYTGTTSNPNNLRAITSVVDDHGLSFYDRVASSLVMFVKKNEYYKITGQSDSGFGNGCTRTYTIVPITDSGSGSGGNCQWLELPQVECDGSGNCRGKISLQTAENNGYTGACYFQKQDNNKYFVGSMVTRDTETTSKSTTILVCKRINEQGTEDRNLDATHKAYYYACTGGGIGSFGA